MKESGTSGKAGEASRKRLQNERIGQLVDKERSNDALDVACSLLVAKVSGCAGGLAVLLDALRPDTKRDAKGTGQIATSNVDVKEVDALDVGQADRDKQLEDERSSDRKETNEDEEPSWKPHLCNEAEALPRTRRLLWC